MITVLGSINVDLVASGEHLPRPGETVQSTSFVKNAGGKGANQAVAARLAGSSVKMVGAVGRDSAASEALNNLSRAGVDLSDIKRVSSATGTALILNEASGENMISVFSGANSHVDVAMAEATVEAMTPGEILLLQLEIPEGTVRAALEFARRKGVRTILNTAPFSSAAPALARLADVVVSNETEFDALIGCSSATNEQRRGELERLGGNGGRTYVLTLGKEGAIATFNGSLETARSLAITPVDTVGAGDTFCGYLAAGLDQSIPFAAAMQRAAVAGSLACLAKGAQTAMPEASTVANRIAHFQG